MRKGGLGETTEDPWTVGFTVPLAAPRSMML